MTVLLRKRGVIRFRQRITGSSNAPPVGDLHMALTLFRGQRQIRGGAESCIENGTALPMMLEFETLPIPVV